MVETVEYLRAEVDRLTAERDAAQPVAWISQKHMTTLLGLTSGIFRMYHGKRRGTECTVPLYAHPATDTLRQVREALDRACNLAMHRAVTARVPECGDFGAIAQDISAAIAMLPKDNHP